ncbi:MAG: AraC family transcriptional regulator N-terminal domain-containing protein [Brucellaceae bacterium]|nr:AraC family transcriptional regulator N-terminal domain-containing protein [Brucellaceae bacterium]
MVRTAPTTLVPPAIRSSASVLQGAKQVQFEGRAMTFARMESLIVGLDVLTATRDPGRAARPYVALAALEAPGLLHMRAGQGGRRGRGCAPSRRSAVATGEADQAGARRHGAAVRAACETACRARAEPLIVKEIHYLLLAALTAPCCAS